VTSLHRRATVRPTWGATLLAWALAGGACAIPVAAAGSGAIDVDKSLARETGDHPQVAWKLGNGAPTGIRAMAQTPDGSLWLGSSTGLYRFDGANFERRDLLPAGSVASPAVGVLHVRRNGDLCVGYAHGGVGFVLSGGAVATYAGLPEGVPVNDFDEDGDGRLWAGTEQGLFVFDGQAWRPAGASRVQPGDLAKTPWVAEWFTALCLAGAVLVLWFAYRLHLHRTTLRLRQRLEERHGERERIARELHDTLLQGIQGLMLRFHVAASHLPEGPVRERLRQALDAADGVLVEGRDRVSELRASSDEVTDLAASYAVLAAEFGVGDAPVLRLVVEGDACQLDPLVSDELYRIGREALFNAFIHAGAREIEVEISFDVDALRLRFRDDGRGIEPPILMDGRDGHWGLRGMRERAEKIGARLDILSGEGRGTEVALSLPARHAYVRGTHGGWRRLLHRLSHLR
jgi:signal transduction histidine kinase